MNFPIESLCDEVLLKVFEYLSAKTLKNASMVCKRWSELIGSSNRTMNKFVWRLEGQYSHRPHWMRGFYEIMDLQRRPQAIYVVLSNEEEIGKFTQIIERHGSSVTAFEIVCYSKVGFLGLSRILNNMPLLATLTLKGGRGEEDLDDDPHVVNRMKLLTTLSMVTENWANYSNWQMFKMMRVVDASKIKELHLVNDSANGPPELIFEFLSAAVNLKSLFLNEKVFQDIFKERRATFPFKLERFVTHCNLPEFLRPDQPRGPRHDEVTEGFSLFLESQAPTLEEFDVEYNFQQEVFEAIFTKLLNVKTMRIKFNALQIDSDLYQRLKPMENLRVLKSGYQFAEEIAAKGVLKCCPNLRHLDQSFFFRFSWLNPTPFKGIVEFISVHNQQIETMSVKTINSKRESEVQFGSLKKVKIYKIEDRKFLTNFIKTNPTIEEVFVDYYDGKTLKSKDLLAFKSHQSLKKLRIDNCSQVYSHGFMLGLGLHRVIRKDLDSSIVKAELPRTECKRFNLEFKK